jgi:hypothetical protein
MGLTVPWATLIVAAVALVVGSVTIWQKWRNDERDAWWKRAQWAIDKSLSADPNERNIGSEAMALFAFDSAVSDNDVRVLQVALRRAVVDTR